MEDIKYLEKKLYLFISGLIFGGNEKFHKSYYRIPLSNPPPPPPIPLRHSYICEKARKGLLLRDFWRPGMNLARPYQRLIYKMYIFCRKNSDSYCCDFDIGSLTTRLDLINDA
jgi:hypothetical protein